MECGVFSSLKNRNRSTYVEATVSYKLVKRFDSLTLTENITKASNNDDILRLLVLIAAGHIAPSPPLLALSRNFPLRPHSSRRQPKKQRERNTRHFPLHTLPTEQQIISTTHHIRQWHTSPNR